jgi:hypothetical protein
MKSGLVSFAGTDSSVALARMAASTIAGSIVSPAVEAAAARATPMVLSVMVSSAKLYVRLHHAVEKTTNPLPTRKTPSP